MKGILLAGGTGSRLFPSTLPISKHLLPVYDKPMVYYSLSVLMLAGLREILIISTPHDTPLLEKLLGDGAQFGLELQYAVQQRSGGVPEALLIGESFVCGQPVGLILGDNLFYGGGLRKAVMRAAQLSEGAVLFGYRVAQPERFGVVSYAPENGKAIRIVEKPRFPPSDTAVTGLYFYDGLACDIARELVPSKRGELEITDVNNWYLDRGRANIETLGRGIAWLDSGTHDSLIRAAQYVQTIQDRQGQYIACLEEIALDNGWIDADIVEQQAYRLRSSSYGHYLSSLVDDARH